VKTMHLAEDDPLAASKTTFEWRKHTILVKRCACIDALARIVGPYFKRRDGLPSEMSSHVVREQVETRDPFVAVHRCQSALRSDRNTDELAISSPSSSEQVERTVTRCPTGSWA
jgi:hypothetical protein